MIHHPPQLDDQRALTATAFVALIDAALSGAATHGHLVPSTQAAQLVQRLTQSGLAEVTPYGDTSRLTLCGIHASSTGTAYGLLRNWQSAARQRIAQGVRP